jgi:hypothetical protein
MSFISAGNLIISLKRQTLSWMVEGQSRRYLRLKPGVVTVGRMKSNDVVIDEEGVSRRHAQLYLEKDGLFIEDIDSTRGTWIGTTRLPTRTRTPVPPDATIWVGEIELKYEAVRLIRIPILWLIGATVSLCLLAALINLFPVVGQVVKSAFKRPPPAQSAIVQVANANCPSTSFLISLPETNKPAVTPTVGDYLHPHP